MQQQKKLHALEKEMRHWKQQQEQLLDEDLQEDLQEDPQDEQSEDPQDEQSEDPQDEQSEDPQDEQHEDVVKLPNFFFYLFNSTHENYYY